MKIGIMQPYFFPYIGYFQLINMVDKYVVFDDGLYAKNKWACRNQILINRTPGYFRVKIMKASHNQTFNEIRISNDIEEKREISELWNEHIEMHLIIRKSCQCRNSS